MDPNRIAELLQPYLGAKALPAEAGLSSEQLRSISIYVELLLHWNTRVNLTAVRHAENIVTRHFGESLFLAAYLFPGPSLPGTNSEAGSRRHALDLGSGAGFPGIPLKIYAPELRLTLVESNHKKAAFLAEVIRALQLSDVSVYAGRLEAGLIGGAEHVVPSAIEPPDLVTMRAVNALSRRCRPQQPWSATGPPGSGEASSRCSSGKARRRRSAMVSATFPGTHRLQCRNHVSASYWLAGIPLGTCQGSTKWFTCPLFPRSYLPLIYRSSTKVE